jgi:hypothetical protein
MPELADDLGFLHEMAALFRRQCAPDRLDGNMALQAGILGQIHDAAAAPFELPNDFETVNMSDACQYLHSCSRISSRDLCTTPVFVIPVKTGIQKVLDNTGYRPAPV